MKTLQFFAFAFILTSLTSCFNNEDPGPLQESEQEYTILDFNRLEMGDALNVTVEQGSIFSVKVKGDRRNIDDLEVKKLGNTLRMRFEKNHHWNRQYTTYVTITMPSIEGATFTGAVKSTITGFTTEGKFDLKLSGASKSQVSITAHALDFDLSGASEANINGVSPVLDATVSGASELRSFDLEAETATIDASGASKIRVLVTKQLNASASGASDIRYRGTPLLNTHTSGASSIGQD
ncbi:MAG TPA: head GIN domain-containing protein [Cyclobacteriaceae bacterium]|nr:head GIN domain-containing protein [Cyclobacteriaceae bacterium]